MPDQSVKESKERVRTAIKNSNFELPSRKIVINLAPADTKKEGSFFDLPIAIGILQNLGYINNESIIQTIFLGELSLNGRLNKINGVLPMCIEAKNLGIKNVILPQENSQEASIVNGLNVIGVSSLGQAVNYLNKKEEILPSISNMEDIFSNNNQYSLDFADVKGQEEVKRALEVAAAGGHNAMLIGSPGAGKTMVSRRIPSILPDLSFDEALEVTKIHSIAGILPKEQPIVTKRPYRAPHHTVSKSSLIGGGKIPKPGEISLAHYGVLFLDELPEFKRETLEVLRGPLEDRTVTISRVSAILTYPCNFMLVASMNPCPCGYYGSKEKECTCSESQIAKYMSKISGPLLDRIDIQVKVNPVKYNKLSTEAEEETSEQIRKRVNNARKIQLERYRKFGIFSNAELTQSLINQYCNLDDKCQKIMENAFEKLKLSARAYTRILKVARTIADLANSNDIKAIHLAEAINYRDLDRENINFKN